MVGLLGQIGRWDWPVFVHVAKIALKWHDHHKEQASRLTVPGPSSLFIVTT
jgi:hypothetical protein